MENAFEGLYRLILNDRTLAQGGEDTSLLSWNHPHWNQLATICSALPKVHSLLTHWGLRGLDRIMTKGVSASYDTTRTLSELQYGMLRLQKSPEAHAFALRNFPLIRDLEQLPPFGWEFYDYLLNFSGFRGENHLQLSCNYVDTFEDRIDGIFQTTAGMFAHYFERLPLAMPEGVPRNWREELLAL